MTPEALRAAALSLPGAVATEKWGLKDVFTVGEKMFAVLSTVQVKGDAETADLRQGVSFKVDDMTFDLLSQEPGVRPAPYLARAKWVQVTDLDAMSDEEFIARLTRAHALVAAKLTKKVRAELGLA